MSRATYGISALLTLSGAATAILGIVVGEGKPLGIGLVLILGGFVFARLYIGTRRQRNPARLGPAAGDGAGGQPLGS